MLSRPGSRWCLAPRPVVGPGCPAGAPFLAPPPLTIKGVSGDVGEVKRGLRAQVRAQRAALTDAQRDEMAAALTTRLDELVEATSARFVSCFVSRTTEPNTAEFIEGALNRGIRVITPVIPDDGPLDWASAAPASPKLLGARAVDDVDLMLIPAAAVDEHGTRLGWGRGFFDRTIGAMTEHPPIYAVVFDGEIFPDLPREPHDQPVTGVVTPTRTLTFSPS